MDPTPQRGTLTRLAARALAAVVDPTVVLSFESTGFRIHSLDFEPGDLDVDMRGKLCLVTGANAGLGEATTRGLAQRGASVRMLCRSAERAEPVAARIRAETGNQDVRVEVIDVSDLGSVRAFAERFTPAAVDVLVHNAGVLPLERKESADGIELTLATNLIGPFLLTHLMRPRLEAAEQGRLVTVSSGGMYPQKLTRDDPQFRSRDFDGVRAYAWTKRAEVILSEMWAERFTGTRVTSNSMHPGWADTGGVRDALPTFYRVMGPLLRDAEQGADTILWLAVCERIARESGKFWFDRKPRRTYVVPGTRESEDDRAWLWRMCEELAGL